MPLKLRIRVRRFRSRRRRGKGRGWQAQVDNPKRPFRMMESFTANWPLAVGNASTPYTAILRCVRQLKRQGIAANMDELRRML